MTMKIKNSNKKAVIFDLDGTLCYSLNDLMNATNHVLDTLSLKHRSLEEVRQFVGNGIFKLIERAIDNQVTFDKNICLNEFKTYYANHCLDTTIPYDGIIELLQTLKSKGILVGIVTNKNNELASIIIKHLFNGLVDVYLGETKLLKKKPEKDMLFKTISDLKIEPKDVLYIGDSEVDILTARNSSVDYLCCLWGYRTKEELDNTGPNIYITSPKEVLEYI